MKLNELLGVKKYKDKTYLDIILGLNNSSNIKKLGDGANSEVLLINGEAYKFWFEDSAYEAFIEYIKKNSNNDFLPKLKSEVKTIPAFFIRHIDAPDRIKYIKLELLKPFKNNHTFEIGDGSDSINVDIIIDIINDHCDVKRNLSKYEYYEIIKDRLSKRLNKAWNHLGNTDDNYIDDFRSYIKDNDLKLFLDTMYDLYSIAISTNSRFDLHPGNFMSRGDVPVILDPIANSDSLKVNKQIYKFNELYRSNKTIDKKEPNNSLKLKT